MQRFKCNQVLDNYVQIHVVPRSSRRNQARYLIGNMLKNCCIKNNINLIPAPEIYCRAISLVERLISTVNQRLACIREANTETNFLILRAALKTIIYQLRICKQKTTGILPFESRYDCRDYTSLTNINTATNNSAILSYDKMLNHRLDEETLTLNEFHPKAQ